MRKEKKSFHRSGYTLVELLGVLVVLAIVFGLAIIGYIGIKNIVRKTYYSGLEESILMAAGEYYNYSDEQIPKVFGEEQIVKLSKLIGDKYIDKVVDQSGKDCDFEESFVRVYKNENNAINYDVCLKCNHDEYSSGECSKMFSYAVNLSGTIGKRVESNIADTKANYQENKYVNSPVVLHVRTTEKMDGKTIVIKKQDEESYEKTCTVRLQSNKTYGCSVNVETSGTYISYGVINGNNTKEASLNVLIDEVKPVFAVEEVTNNGITEITANKDLQTIELGDLTINVNSIKDTISGIRNIRYAFYKDGERARYTNVNISNNSFTYNKTFEQGIYTLVIIVSDNAGNENKYEKKYQFKGEIDDGTLACPTGGVFVSANSSPDLKQYQYADGYICNENYQDSIVNKVVINKTVLKDDKEYSITSTTSKSETNQFNTNFDITVPQRNNISNDEKYVVFVIDSSPSIGEVGYYIALESAIYAANNIIRSNPNSQVAFIKFAGDAYTTEWESKDKITSLVGELSEVLLQTTAAKKNTVRKKILQEYFKYYISGIHGGSNILEAIKTVKPLLDSNENITETSDISIIFMGDGAYSGYYTNLNNAINSRKEITNYYTNAKLFSILYYNSYLESYSKLMLIYTGGFEGEYSSTTYEKDPCFPGEQYEVSKSSSEFDSAFEEIIKRYIVHPEETSFEYNAPLIVSISPIANNRVIYDINGKASYDFYPGLPNTITIKYNVTVDSTKISTEGWYPLMNNATFTSSLLSESIEFNKSPIVHYTK